MGILRYVKVSDVDYDFCFLEVFRSDSDTPFMDIRISDDRKLFFFVYENQPEISLSPEEWIEIHEKALLFYKSELENENPFDNWSGS